MTKKSLPWKKIVQLAAGVSFRKMVLIVAGISAGMSSPAWATGTGLYEMHTDGTVWQYQGGEPCKEGVCSGWLQIRGAGNTYSIAGGGGTGYLALMDNDVNYFVYNGEPCVGDYCPGWNQIGAYPLSGWACPGFTFASGLSASGGTVLAFFDGATSIFTGGPFALGSSCPWTLIDFNYDEGASATVGEAGIFEMHWDGSIWSYPGTPCTDNNYYLNCAGWVQLDGNPNSSSLAIGATSLYEKWQNGAIWKYTGPPCNSITCPGWVQIGDNPNTSQIAAGGFNMYQTQTDGSIWQFTGQTCNGNTCSGWVKLDNNPDMAYIVAGQSTVFEVHKSGSIWEYNGTPCNSNGVCSGWVELDNNANTNLVVGGF
ncbi:MAG: hypothetical protein ABSF64_36675 [Bryobacteraceae bacterium]|jgi:hypothetical protein